MGSCWEILQLLWQEKGNYFCQRETTSVSTWKWRSYFLFLSPEQPGCYVNTYLNKGQGFFLLLLPATAFIPSSALTEDYSAAAKPPAPVSVLKERLKTGSISFVRAVSDLTLYPFSSPGPSSQHWGHEAADKSHSWEHPGFPSACQSQGHPALIQPGCRKHPLNGS